MSGVLPTDEIAERYPDGLPEHLYTDIESTIHQHCGHDGQSDEANDWVTDLMTALSPLILRALVDEHEALRSQLAAARDELAEKWELYQACTSPEGGAMPDDTTTDAPTENRAQRRHRQRQATAIEPLAVSPTEAAEMVSVGRTRIYELMAAGELPFAQYGASRLIRVADLRDWLDRQVAEAS